MHACGHDLHTAMLAGAARLLSARQPELAGNVIFMFQPGEEGYAGARLMIKEGVLDAAGEPAGRRVRTARRLGAAAHGQSRHPARPDHGRRRRARRHRARARRARARSRTWPHDPIPAACEMVTALQTLVTRRFDVFDPVVITVGSFHAGTTDNVIPDEAHFLATVRSFSAAARDRVRAASVRLVTDIATAHGLQASAEYLDGYPVTVNDARRGRVRRAGRGRRCSATAGSSAGEPAARGGGLLVRARSGARGVHHAGRLPGGHGPGQRAVQPRRGRRVR